MRGKLLSLEKKLIVNKHREARENERKSQSYHKEYPDKRRHAKKSTIKIGDTLLVRQIKQNKLTTRFNKMPCVVINRKCTKVTAENSKHRITRNVSHFKRINAYVNRQHYCSDSESEYEHNNENHYERDAEHENVNNNENANNL